MRSFFTAHTLSAQFSLKLSLTLVLAVSPLALASPTVKKSSVIPEKREFVLSSEVNPCDNFHQYVCSNVENSFELRKDRSSHTFAFNDSHDRILEHKKTFLKNIKNEKELSPRALQIKDSYLACMNISANKRGEKEFVKLIQEEISKLKTPQDLLKYDFDNLSSGRGTLLTFDATNSSANPDIHVAFMSINFMGLPDHSYYENAELVESYKKLQSDFFKTIQPRLSKKEIVERVEKMFEFEKKFILTYPKPEVRRQRWSENREFSQADTIKKYANLNLPSYFSLIPKETLVRIPVPEGLEFYNSNLDEAQFKTIKDILLYKKTAALMDDAYPDFFKKKFEFRRKYFGGPEKRTERQERCTLQVMGTFEKEFDQVMIPKLFPNFPEDKIKIIAAKIRESILQGIDNNQWLTRKSKTEAKKKIQNYRMQIVMPTTDKEWDFNPVQTLSENEPIRNQIKLSQAYYQKMISEIPKPTNKEAWGMGPLTVNAYISFSENKFVMPMGILQYPFFVPDGDLIENLGAVGAVVGHELGHGIDDQGSKYDATGRLNQWMDMKDLAEFQKRGEKMIAQFDKAGHNGRLTLGENVGDLVGLTFAYRAAFPEGEGRVEDKKRFFISYARLWCGVQRPGLTERLLKTDPHALGWARINEQVKHQKAFEESFSCKATDKMVLPDSDRVQIW